MVPSHFDSVAAHRKTLICVGACAVCLLVCATDAEAYDPFRSVVGGFVGGFVGGMMERQFERQGHHAYAPVRPQRSTPRVGGGAAPAGARRSSPAEATPSPADSARVLASLAPPASDDQKAILKRIYTGSTLGAVGSSNDLDQIGKSADSDDQRDYAGRVAKLIDRMSKRQDADSPTKDGDVTEHSILESLDTAIQETNLLRFETFLGEYWSAERLRVMILDRASSGIETLFHGTAKTVAMHDVDSVIRSAARSVYSQLFETSELLAANRGATLFMERLYQTHGALVNDEMRDKAEHLLEQVSISGAMAVEPLLRRDANVYALRYRAQRIIYDCLSDNVEAISSSESGMADAAEISKRVLDLSQKECGKWVDAQLIGPDNKVKPQEPMPLRVIWTAEGPKDDPSMYGRAADQL